MNRSKDLDTIAPDDPIVSTSKKETAKNVNISSKDKSEPVSVPKKPDIFSKPKKQLPIDDDFYQKIYTILGHTKSPFSSFLVRPKVLTFSERDDGEEIYLAVRPHWATNLRWMFAAVLMLFIPFFFHYFSFLNFFPSQYQFSAVLFWYLFTFIFAFEKFLDWYFDLFMVTNERVVDISFNNLLNKHLSLLWFLPNHEVLLRV